MTDINTVVSVFAIASPIVGWGLIYWRNSQKRVVTDTVTSDSIEQIKSDIADLKAKAAYIAEIKDIKQDIADIKSTLGNGAYHGIKQDIIDMKLNCAKEMAELAKQSAICDQRIDTLETRS